MARRAVFGLTLALAVVCAPGEPARAVWLPQLRLARVSVVVLHRGDAEVLVMTLGAEPGFTLGEASRLSWVLPVPRGARAARAAGNPVADALGFVDTLRAAPSPAGVAGQAAAAPISLDAAQVLTGSPAAVEALLRGELRLSGAVPPPDVGLAYYRDLGWTYVLARARPRSAPPFSLGPLVVAMQAPRPVVPVHLLAGRPPVAVDVVLVTDRQPVLVQDALRGRGLAFTELVDSPPTSPDDVPLTLPFSQVAYASLPASLRAAVNAVGSGAPAVAWQDDELVHVAHVHGRLEEVGRWPDELRFDTAVAAPTAAAPAPSSGAREVPVTAVAPETELPTGPAGGTRCGCRVGGAAGPARPELALGLLLAGVLGLRRGRRFSRDPSRV